MSYEHSTYFRRQIFYQNRHVKTAYYIDGWTSEVMFKFIKKKKNKPPEGYMYLRHPSPSVRHRPNKFLYYKNAISIHFLALNKPTVQNYFPRDNLMGTQYGYMDQCIFGRSNV